MMNVDRHEVGTAAVERALTDIEGRALGRWHRMEYDCYSDAELCALRDDLLDHLAARTLTDPQLRTEASVTVARTAAECALGYLDLGSFPNGDQEIRFPLIGKRLSSENHDFEPTVEHASTAGDWLDAFALSLISGLMYERNRVIGLLLRDDHAPAIRAGVPYSKLNSVSDPGELAEMDTLACYLTGAEGHPPRQGAVPVRMPEVDERLDGILRLREAGELTPDQRLLRVLMEDDRTAFERALAERLEQYRHSVPAGAAPRSLLPHRTVALAALAVRVHGWDLRVRSPYLPQGLLQAPAHAVSV
ncbi:immunity 49 family protein [Streptomyces sp. SBST2-5]|uniref:Immunity 49 family protein n=1 Tax=Streptomyces composti TaxID=2720025 RepID=A0ABX1A419_9ACTN|nr:immunity 49 family protein [Streptomyces composti]